MRTLLNGTLLFTLASATVLAPINAGDLKPEPDLPFTMAEVATFKLPWRIAFLPDGRMLVTEKVGPVWLVTQQGKKTPVVVASGKGDILTITKGNNRTAALTKPFHMEELQELIEVLLADDWHDQVSVDKKTH